MGWAALSDAAHGCGLFQSSDRSVCLWDGRIDNRKELLHHAGLSMDYSDAALILSLYEKHGVDGLRDVVGDWSLAIWDANRREIVLASDYAGIRPLYYHRSTAGVYWSSSLADLVRWTGVRELDVTYVASFLAIGRAPTRTPYAGILPVPAGHAVSIAQDRIEARAFWMLPIHRETRYPDERQYEERMLELFRESVQARLATGAPTCSELSGGLDSSSIVCMADRLRKETHSPAPELITFSYTHENSRDEKFFREVERACNLTGCHLELRECPAAAAGRMGTEPAWWEPRFQEVARRMAAVRSSVLLTGQFGDFIMGNTTDDSGQVTEWLAKGRFGKAAREAYAWGRSEQVPIYPILWRAIREAWFSWVPSVDPRDSVGAIPAIREDSLAEELRARFESYERERLADDTSRHAPPGRRRRFRSAAEVLRSRTLQAPEALQHISYTHPYAHRPLVEFMLTIPAHVAFGPEQPRRLMRRAFAGLLPPLILGRKSKASYMSMYRGALIPLAAALLKSPEDIRLVERGFVDRRSLIGRLEKFTQGLDCNETQLRQVLLLEFWLRDRMPFSHSSESAAPRPELAVSTS
jgi:asparagine synthase (glutamine-hydrolysing)